MTPAVLGRTSEEGRAEVAEARAEAGMRRSRMWCTECDAPFTTCNQTGYLRLKPDRLLEAQPDRLREAQSDRLLEAHAKAKAEGMRRSRMWCTECDAPLTTCNQRRMDRLHLQGS